MMKGISIVTACGYGHFKDISSTRRSLHSIDLPLPRQVRKKPQNPIVWEIKEQHQPTAARIELATKFSTTTVTIKSPPAAVTSTYFLKSSTATMGQSNINTPSVWHGGHTRRGSGLEYSGVKAEVDHKSAVKSWNTPGIQKLWSLRKSSQRHSAKTIFAHSQYWPSSLSHVILSSLLALRRRYVASPVVLILFHVLSWGATHPSLALFGLSVSQSASQPNQPCLVVTIIIITSSAV